MCSTEGFIGFFLSVANNEVVVAIRITAATAEFLRVFMACSALGELSLSPPSSTFFISLP